MVERHKQRTNEGFIALDIVYLVTFGKRITENAMRTVKSRQLDLWQYLQIQFHGIRLIASDWNS